MNGGGRPWAGVLLVAGAAVLWSTSGLFAKAPWFDDWETHTRVTLMAFWRAIFASAVMVFLIRRPAWDWRMVPMMACFAGMSWSFLQALVVTEATTAIWLQYTAPVFVVIGSFLFFREVIHRRDAWFLVVALGGLAIILAGQVGRASTAGLAYGILAGVLYAGVILFLRALREFDSAWLVFLNQAATVLVFLPLVARLDSRPEGFQWICLGGFGIVQLGLPYLLFANGVRSVPGHQASLIVLLEPLLVPLWVFLFWRHAENYQPPLWTTIVGGAVILVTLVIRYAVPRRAGAA